MYSNSDRPNNKPRGDEINRISDGEKEDAVDVEGSAGV